MKGLAGKTAIISGGATLIGRSVTETLAGYGENVVIASGKPGIFIAGADIKVFANAPGPNDPTVRAFVEQGLRVLAVAKRSWNRAVDDENTVLRVHGPFTDLQQLALGSGESAESTKHRGASERE